jgi:hypothetical protein
MGIVARTPRDTEVEGDVKKSLSSNNHLFGLVRTEVSHETTKTAHRNQGSQCTETCQHPSVDNKDDLHDSKG